MDKFKYFAFISYSSKDTAWGKRLQRKLEHYRIPTTLCKERGLRRRPINPVFFAPTDIQPGGLDEELKARLYSSKNLIVICSPHSAKSEWVGKEIEYFHELGRDKNIHFFIVDGIPNSGDRASECFNPVVKTLGLPEILGANVNEKIYRLPWLNRERAYVQLISKLLDVEFDSIWKRHRRQLVAKCVSWTMVSMAMLAVIGFVWLKGRPFSSMVALDEISAHNPYLPPLHDAVVTLYLDSEVKIDTIAHEGEYAHFRNIPSDYLNKDVRVAFSCPDFVPLDTIVRLGRKLALSIRRAPEVYGKIRTELFDFRSESPVANVNVVIDRWETQSDSAGIVSFFVPLEHQRPAYSVRISDYGISDSIFMPSGEFDVIAVK